jgi:glycosyltransferase involved in cell wall biosynthesis
MYSLFVPVSSSVLHNSPLSNSSKRIWVVNPFDELPNATDVPLRYWALCRTLAEQGHEVIWWSSDFSHRTKTQREPCPPTDGFSIRLIASTPYAKNISLARLKNHKQFAQGFFRDAIDGLKSGALNAPDRIVVSLPPLGVAEQAFKIRDFVNQIEGPAGASRTAPNIQKGRGGCPPLPPSISHSPSAISHHDCQVVVDIMDAWPEAFYQVLPKPLRTILGPILLAPMRRSAQRAYEGADKISAVGQNYLERAKGYLPQGRGQRTDTGNRVASAPDSFAAKGNEDWALKQPSYLQFNSDKKATGVSLLRTPTHLCYHGTDLERVANKKEDSAQRTVATQRELRSPIKLVYIGALETSYDLNTILEATKLLNQKGSHTEFHIAGVGSREASLKELIQRTNQALRAPVIFFHGYLQKTELDALLHQAHFGMIPMTDASFVGLPYKMADYTRMGLPMLSSLDGECRELIEHKKAGAFYRSGSSARLVDAIQSIIQQPVLYHSMSSNSRQIAEQLFDRSITYQALAAFIVNASS